jgi:transposase
MLKHFRAIATRHDKLAKTLLASVRLASAAILLKRTQYPDR